MTLNMLDKNSVQAGDVLLCFSSAMQGKGIVGIEYGYEHAALGLENSKVLEASAQGVAFTCIDKLLVVYEHIAILRAHGQWGAQRLNALREFALENVGKKFNRSGMAKYADRKKKYEDTAMERVHQYFEGTEPPVSAHKELYFCSELVLSAFISVGIIDESAAATLFTPETFSPEDIGKDKWFGFFIGYIVSHDQYQIPDNDMFRNLV